MNVINASTLIIIVTMVDSTKVPRPLVDETEIMILGRVIATAFSHLWTKNDILIHYRNAEK